MGYNYPRIRLSVSTCVTLPITFPYVRFYYSILSFSIAFLYLFYFYLFSHIEHISFVQNCQIWFVSYNANLLSILLCLNCDAFRFSAFTRYIYFLRDISCRECHKIQIFLFPCSIRHAHHFTLGKQWYTCSFFLENQK